MSECRVTSSRTATKSWRWVPLGEVASKIQDGTHFSPQSEDGPFRYVTSKNIRPGRLDLSHCGRISEEEHNSIYARCDVRQGDVLLTKDGANTGNACLNCEPEPFSLLSSVAFLRAEGTPNSAGYVLQYLLSPEGQRRISDLMSGNAITRLTLEKIRAFEIPLPPPSAQRRIAEILSTVDEAIEQTEALIAKTQQIKTGLMHDLFTRGVTPDGRLRPPRDEAPELYKQSPLGWIPREWEVARIGCLVESWAMGPRFPADQYTKNGSVATLRTTDMDAEGNINYSSMPRAELDVARLSQHLLRPGDVVISRSGTCGVAGVFGGHPLRVLPGAFLIRFRFNSVIRSDFVRHFINSPFGLQSTQRIAEGGVQKNLRGTELCRVILPVPGPFEQEVACSLLRTVNLRHETGRESVRALQKLKKGLMQNLLSCTTPVEGD